MTAANCGIILSGSFNGENTGTFFVSVERGDSYLSSSTKIIRIGFVDVLQKMA